MAQVLVRDLPEEVVADLKTQAASNGRSLEAELRHILTEATRAMRRDRMFKEMERIRESQQPYDGPDSLTLLRADRARHDDR